MLTARRIQPGTKIRFRLIATEDDLRPGDDFQDTATHQPVLLTPDDSDDIEDKDLYAIFKKFQTLFDIHTDEEPPMTLRFGDAKGHRRPDSPARLIDWDNGRWS